MKRALLAIILLLIGTAVFCAVRSRTAETRQKLAVQRSAWQTQTQQLARLYLEKQQVTDRVTVSKQLYSALPPLPTLQQLEQKVLAGDSLTNLSATETEQLLGELGFNWNTTGDYLIISKKSLDAIGYDAMKGAKLSAAGRETLAITPAEQAELEALTGQLDKAHAAWAKDHVQRTEPGGDVVAKYTLPVDEDFSRSQNEAYTNGILSALGAQRAGWLADHSQEWMEASGVLAMPDMSRLPKEVYASLPADAFQPKPTTMTVTRSQNGDTPQFNLNLQSGNGSMMTTIGPWQPFPQAFHSIFPGGWKDLAAAEGFELPPEFNKKK